MNNIVREEFFILFLREERNRNRTFGSPIHNNKDGISSWKEGNKRKAIMHGRRRPSG